MFTASGSETNVPPPCPRTRQARLWKSKTMDSVIVEGGTRPVGIPSESGVTFDTVFQMIMDLGATVYVYGGVLRDVIMKGAHVADDSQCPRAPSPQLQGGQ